MNLTLFDRAARGKRGPIRFYLPYICYAWALGVFGYGFLFHFSAPITPCGVNEFCDKRHVKRTWQEYQDFRHWEMLLLGSLPFGIAGDMILRQRKKELAAKSPGYTDANASPEREPD